MVYILYYTAYPAEIQGELSGKRIKMQMKKVPGSDPGTSYLSMKFNTFCELFKEHSTAHWHIFLFRHICTNPSVRIFIFRFALLSYVICGARLGPCLLVIAGL